MITDYDLLNAAFASYDDEEKLKKDRQEAIDNGKPDPGPNYFDRLADEGYERVMGDGYTVDDEARTGFFASTWRNKSTKETIVAFRGTAGLSDAAADAQRGWPQWANNQDRIRALLDKVRQDSKDSNTKFALTGHSLGGALCQFAIYDYVKRHTATAKDEVSLATWNGLAGEWGLKENLLPERLTAPYSYDPDLLRANGVSARHFYNFDDLVARLGGRHLVGVEGALGQNGASESFRRLPDFESGKDDMTQTRWLGDAHRYRLLFEGLVASEVLADWTPAKLFRAPTYLELNGDAPDPRAMDILGSFVWGLSQIAYGQPVSGLIRAIGSVFTVLGKENQNTRDFVKEQVGLIVRAATRDHMLPWLLQVGEVTSGPAGMEILTEFREFIKRWLPDAETNLENSDDLARLPLFEEAATFWDKGNVFGGLKNFLASVEKTIDALKGAGRAAVSVVEALGELATELAKSGVELTKTVLKDGKEEVQELFDIGVREVEEAAGKTLYLDVTIKPGFSSSNTMNVKPDFGLGGLIQLNGDLKVNIESGLQTKLRFGKDADGWFLDTTRNQDELKLDLSASLAEGSKASAKVFNFFNYEIADKPAVDPLKPDGPRIHSNVSGGIYADLQEKVVEDENGQKLSNGDGKLRLNELTNGAAKFVLSTDAKLDLNLGLKISDDLPFMPKLKADLNVDWSLKEGGAPTVVLANAKLDVSSTVGFAREIFSNLSPMIDGVKRVTDILTKPISILNTIGLKDVSLLDIAYALAKIDQSAYKFVKTVNGIARVAAQIRDIVGSGEIDLGNFKIENPFQNYDPKLKQLALDIDVLGGLGQAAGVLGSAVNAVLSKNASADKFMEAYAGFEGGGIRFPLLEDPKRAVLMLLGKDVTLFDWDLPKFNMGFSLHQTFPVLGPIAVGGGIRIEGQAQMGLGFDTSGLRKYVQYPGEDAPEALILKGLYLKQYPGYEVSAGVGIEVKGGIDLGIISAWIGAGIYGTLGLDLRDPDKDGRLHLWEIGRNAGQVPSIFAFKGKLEAGVFTEASINLGFYKKEWRWERRITLIEFGDADNNPPQNPSSILNTPNNGVAELKIAGFPTEDPKGDKLQILEVTSKTKPLEKNIEIWFGNDSEILFGPDAKLFAQTNWIGTTTIKASLLAGNDRFLARGINGLFLTFKDAKNPAAGVEYQAKNFSISGGLGDDNIEVGAGADTLDGGSGKDKLISGAGIDSLMGGEGDDELFAGLGNDTLIGDGLIDATTSGIVAGTAVSGPGVAANTKVVSVTPASIVLSAAASLSGAAELTIGNSKFYFESSEGSVNATLLPVIPGAGNDVLKGDAGDDLLLGGPGADILEGGAGSDRLFGGTGADEIVADDDGAVGGNDFVVGGRGGDFIFGGSGQNTLIGGGLNEDEPTTDRDFDVNTFDDVFDVSRGVNTVFGGSMDTNTGAAFADGGFDVASYRAQDIRRTLEVLTESNIRNVESLKAWINAVPSTDDAKKAKNALVTRALLAMETPFIYGPVKTPLSLKAASTAGSDLLTVDSSVGFQTDMAITGRGIPAGTKVLSMVSATQVKMSKAATLTGSAFTVYSVQASEDEMLFGNELGKLKGLLDLDNRQGVFLDLEKRSVPEGYFKQGFNEAQGDRLYGIEQVEGTDLNDEIRGNGSDNVLLGNAGNDTLIGRDGHDYLEGGEGADYLIGDDPVDATVTTTIARLLTEMAPTLRRNTVGGLTTTKDSKVASVTNTAGMAVGMSVGGPGIPEGTKVTRVTSATQFEMSASATESASGKTLAYGKAPASAAELLAFLRSDPAASIVRGLATVANNAEVTVESTAALAVGDGVSGRGIPAGATIVQIVSGTRVKLSAAATETSTATRALAYQKDGKNPLAEVEFYDKVAREVGDRLGLNEADTIVYLESAFSLRVAAESSDSDRRTLKSSENGLGALFVGVEILGPGIAPGSKVIALNAAAGSFTLDKALVGAVSEILLNPSQLFSYRDTASYEASPEAIYINLGTGETRGGDAQGDVLSSIEVIYGSGSNDTLVGNQVDNYLRGNRGEDLLVAGDGDDTLDGGAGKDTLDGGKGSDLYFVASREDTIVEADGTLGGFDEVRSAISYTLPGGIENLRLLEAVSADYNVENWRKNHATSETISNSDVGGQGVDNALKITELPDVEADGTPRVFALRVGVDASDPNRKTLNALEKGIGSLFVGMEILGPGIAPKSKVTAINATTGSFTLDKALVGAVSAVLLNPADTIFLPSWGVGNEADNIITGNSEDNTILGGGGADRLLGMEGNDYIDGQSGRDVMEGGFGNDTYIVDDPGEVVIEIKERVRVTDVTSDGKTFREVDVLSGGMDTVLVGFGAPNFTFDLSLGSAASAVEVIKLTNDFPTVLVGNDLPNSIFGGAGSDKLYGGTLNDSQSDNDYLDGGAGIDRMIGGKGNDTYVVDNPLEVSTIEEKRGEGTDTVIAKISFDLSRSGLGDLTEFEYLTLDEVKDAAGRVRNLQGFASNTSNVLTGNSGDNVLGAFDGNDTIIGGEGNDTLLHGAGIDRLEGGAGFDFADYYVRATKRRYELDDPRNADPSSRDADDGENLVETRSMKVDLTNLSASSVAITGGETESLAGIEAVRTGTANDTIDGGAEANRLDGSDGNDTIKGGGGADTLIGGRGDDNLSAVGDRKDPVYQFIGERLDWEEARRNAEARGGHLAVITSSTEWEAFKKQINTQLGYLGDGWLGATDLPGVGGNFIPGTNQRLPINASEKNWKWITGERWTFSNWAGGEPNNVHESFEHGGFFNSHRHYRDHSEAFLHIYANGLWNDVPGWNQNLEGHWFSDIRRGYYLELPPILVTTPATLDGGEGNDRLTGGRGNDSLDGGAGLDTMLGGKGNDTYVVDDLREIPFISDEEVNTITGGGLDTLKTYVTLLTAPASSSGSIGKPTFPTQPVEQLTAIEEFVLAGSGDIGLSANGLPNRLIGNAGSNTLYGLSGDDTLIGGGGNDYLDGGSGSDWYFVQGSHFLTAELYDDVVESEVWTGWDLLFLERGGAAIPLCIEEMILQPAYRPVPIGNIDPGGIFFAVKALGDHRNNRIYSGGYASIAGGGGDDWIVGAGDDTLEGGEGNDTLISGTGLSLPGVRFAVIEGEYTWEQAKADAARRGGRLAVVNTEGEQKLLGYALNQSRTALLADDLGEYHPDLYAGLWLGASREAGADTAWQWVDGTLVDAGFQGWMDGEFDYANGVFTRQFLVADTEGMISAEGITRGAWQTNPDPDWTLPGYVIEYGALSGASQLRGGMGNDHYVQRSLADSITENAGEGYDVVEYKPLGFDRYAPQGMPEVVPYVIPANVEEFTYAGPLSDPVRNAIVGDSGPNSLVGSFYQEVFIGGPGADTMVGGEGGDTYYVDDMADVIVENAEDWGEDIVLSSVAEFVLPAGVERIEFIGRGDFVDAGLHLKIPGATSQTIKITAGLGADLIDASAQMPGQSALLTGGWGDDTYVAGSSRVLGKFGGTGDLPIDSESGNVFIVESAGGGTDLLRADLSTTLPLNVENLELTGSANSSGYGNELANRLTGNSGDNLLMGGAGNDTLDGGTGSDDMYGGHNDDTYIVDSAGDRVSESQRFTATNPDLGGVDTVRSSVDYILGQYLENLVLTGTALNGMGNELGNRLIGNDLPNNLMGLEGDDVLDGGAGADNLQGGSGNDTYYVDDLGDLIFDTDGEDVIFSSVADYALPAGIERIEFVGGALDRGINVVGTEATKTLSGGNGNDTLSAPGANLMLGYEGSDLYVVNDIGDQIEDPRFAEDQKILSSIEDTVLPSVIGSLELAGGATSAARRGTGNDWRNVMIGNELDNTFQGMGGDDFLDGRAGTDSLVGGAGNDTYILDAEGDVADESGDDAGDEVRAPFGLDLRTYSGGKIERFQLLAATAATITGNAAANSLTGNAGRDSITGWQGDDFLDGGAGIDTLTGGIGSDTYVVDNSADVVVEEAEAVSAAKFSLAPGAISIGSIISEGVVQGAFATVNLAAHGYSPGQRIRIDGGTSPAFLLKDYVVIYADANSFTVRVPDGTSADAAANSITVQLITADHVVSKASYTLPANVEELELSGAADIDGTGNDLDNLMTGNDGNNLLDPATGLDTMAGGKGDDTYVVDQFVDRVVEYADEGTDLVRSSSSFLLPANVENLTLVARTRGTSEDPAGPSAIGNALSNSLKGNAEDNVLDGSFGADPVTFFAGNDTLDGGAGADTMIGGFGDNLYIVDNAGDVIDERGSDADKDSVRSSVDWVLGSKLENLKLTGNAAVRAEGNELANFLSGNIAANILLGKGGADTLEGLAGNDTLDGGAGADRMAGGTGNDFYVVDDAADIVSEDAESGRDTVLSSVAYALGADVENLRLTGAAPVNGTGNDSPNMLAGNEAANLLSGLDGSDTLEGFSGNDTLNGGLGADSLVGGAGDDFYVLDDISDFVLEEADGGTDLVQSETSHVLGANVENLRLNGPLAIEGTGNEIGNDLEGSAVSNNLSGLAGNDTLTGALRAAGAGTGEIDTLTGGTGNDLFRLGDAQGRFYDDGSPFNTGRGDYALITDFTPGQDQLELHGIGSAYYVGPSLLRGEPGVGLYAQTGFSDELIAVLRSGDGTPLTKENTLDQARFVGGV